MRQFFAEIKRRHVYRVAVIYAAVAWVLVQVADVVFENFNLPERAMQLFIFCAAFAQKGSAIPRETLAPPKKDY